MPERDPRKAPYVDPDPSKVSRREALSDSLRPGRHLDQERAFSTLVRRSEGDSDPLECDYCAHLIRAAVNHLTGHVVIDDYPAGYEALRRAVMAFPSSLSASAGGADGSGDVVDDQGEGQPATAARDECHEGTDDRED
jgi:hypothetical protein